jgi:hypothetical protein
MSHPHADNVRLVILEVSHDRVEETPEAKARWFRSLTMGERMEVLCSFTDLALAVNPDVADKRDAQQALGRIQIVSRP